MKKIAQIASFFSQKTPESSAEKWDNVGLLVGDPDWETSGAIVSDDLTLEAVQAAQANGFNLIVNHHPCIFPSHRGINRLSPGKDRQLSTLIFECIRNGIAVIATHTNFDQYSFEAMKDFTHQMGLKHQGRLFESMRAFREKKDIEHEGYGAFGEYSEEESFESVSERIKKVFQVENFISTKPAPSSVKRIGFVPGKGSGFVTTAAKLGCDLFITGELDYHEAMNSMRLGMCAVELGHRESEIFYLKTVDEWLKSEGLQTQIVEDSTQEIR